MRQQLWRSLQRSQRLVKLNAARGFSSSVRRPAEVELTVDGKKVSIEGAQDLSRSIECVCMETDKMHSWLSLDSSLREGRRHDPAILLPRETHDCRKLQNVSG